ncbi:formylglycine-generating enzyme family protein [Nibrella viscosa]|uniref:formylglycine-generating enzyme family protein n=1 Tax=Nibrella viscosa TaxID=1084524 RepID=UPI00351A0893
MLQVGSFEPNRLGLYDMSGNASEWCSDWETGYSNEAQVDPTGPPTGDFKVVRGGSCCGRLDQCLVFDRNFGDATPRYRHLYMGFRIVAPSK